MCVCVCVLSCWGRGKRGILQNRRKGTRSAKDETVRHPGGRDRDGNHRRLDVGRTAGEVVPSNNRRDVDHGRRLDHGRDDLRHGHVDANRLDGDPRR